MIVDWLKSTVDIHLNFKLSSFIEIRRKVGIYGNTKENKETKVYNRGLDPLSARLQGLWSYAAEGLPELSPLGLKKFIYKKECFWSKKQRF